MLVRLTRIQALLVIFTTCLGSLGSWFAYSIAATVEKQNVETSLYEIAYTQALKAQATFRHTPKLHTYRLQGTPFQPMYTSMKLRPSFWHYIGELRHRQLLLC